MGHQLNKYYEVNRKQWDERTELHFRSDFYDMAGFLKGRNSLNEIELQMLGDVNGKKILHLQCHFGQDSLSLARMGAKVTGVDLSPKAIEKARQINEQVRLDAQFVCCNVLEIDEHINETFDIVFTSYGTVGWLPGLTKWGQLVADHLLPGGCFVMAEFHPFVYTWDADFQRLQYSYFNRETIHEKETGTYTDADEKPTLESYSWNHPLSDIFGSLLKAGLRLRRFEEFDYSPYDCFNHTVKTGKGFQIQGMEGILPMVFAVEFFKD